MAQTQTPTTFRSAGDSIPYTPSGSTAVYAGDVVLLGSVVAVASNDINVNGQQPLGALQIRGIVIGPKDASTFNAGDAVYWNPTGNPNGGTAGTGCFTSTASGNYLAGMASPNPGQQSYLTGDASLDLLLDCQVASAVTGAITVASVSGSSSTLPVQGLTAAQGGSASLIGGTSSTSANAGGAALVTGGTPGATGVGGAVTIAGGIGGATSGAGGAVSMTGGVGTNGNAAGGAASVTGGAGQGTANGGAMAAAGGASGAGATGNGGAISATGGAALSTNGNGGAASLVGGLGTGTGAGGAITITSGAAGATGVAGAVNISVGAATAGIGSALTLTAGNGAGSTNGGGAINLVPGTAVSTGTPGEVQINSVSGFFDVQYNSPLMTTVVPASGTAQPIFMADRAYRVKAARFCVVTHGTSEAFTITKDASGTAPGGGTALLTGAVATAVANTPVAGTLIATVASLTMAAGDRLSFLTSGTIGSAAGLSVSVLLEPC